MLSSANKLKPKSYAQAAKSAPPTANVSLLHNDVTPTEEPNVQYSRTSQTRLYRSARSPGAILFDITACRDKYTDQQCMIELVKQHPLVYACVPLNDGPKRYLEVYTSSKDVNDDIFTKGIIFEECKLQVLPCRAVDDTAKIITLKLSHLPMFEKNEVVKGLKESLTMFGEILDLGITTEKKTGLFMGYGYAVLNIAQRAGIPNKDKYPDLSHEISWCESDKEFFHATWNNMPTWCRYCHKQDHTKFDCSTAKARVLCYSCHKQGHRSFECPRKNNASVPNKKILQRKSYLDRDAPREIDVKEVIVVKKKTEAVATKESDEISPEQPLTGNSVPETPLVDDEDAIMYDDDEQIYQDNIVHAATELDEYTPSQLEKAILDLYNDNEVTTVNRVNGGYDWKLLKKTERAEAFMLWLQNHQAPVLHLPNRVSTVTTASDSLAVNTSKLN